MKHKKIKYPELALSFLTRITREENKPAVIGDLKEEYKHVYEEKGIFKAKLWCLVQILKSVLPLMFNSIYWGHVMFKNYLKISVRNIRRHKGYSFINIAGLAVGMACFILTLMYANYEFSYESHNPNANRVYLIYVEHREPDEVHRVSHTPVPLVEALNEEIPEIEDFTRFDAMPNCVVNYDDKRFIENDIVAADPGIFDIFGFRLLKGERETALKDMYSIVITEDIAEKYFGNEDPLGKTLLLDNSVSFTIRGVIQNHPSNTYFDPDILISFSTIKELYGSGYTTNWLSQVLQSYILVPENHSVENLENKIETCFGKYRAKEHDKRTLKIERLSRMHLYSIFSDNGIQTITIFLAIGILILVIACVNYMNLSTARSVKRAREVGMRKVVGARKKQIIIQFLGESFIYTFLALILALLLAAGLIPLLRNITGQALVFEQIGRIPILISIFSAFLLVGFLSGSYPAMYLSAFRPANILKETVITGKKGIFFRKILVVSQFSISIILIICTFILIRQINYLINKPLGFKKNHIVVIRNTERKEIESFKQSLLNNPRIESVCGSMLLPHSIRMYNEVTWEGAVNDEIITIKHNTVDYDFLDTYEIPLVAGRNFSRDFPSDVRTGSRGPENAGAVILNENAVKRFGWNNPIGKKVIQTFGEQRIYYTVIGMIKDFHFSSLRNPIGPLKIFLGSSPSYYVSIKIHPENIKSTLNNIESTWNKFNPNSPFEYFFYDSIFEQRYRNEQNLLTLFKYFSFLAIFIGCLGLFGLASFAVEKRSREIAIRKILGASCRGLTFLLVKEFIKCVLIANVIAWPIAYYVINQWLKGYAYHTSVNFWIFILSGCLALAIALFTVSIKSIKAAFANPADNLRYE